MRLDQMLANRGFVQSRSRARDAVLRGCVKVNGVVINRPGQKVSDESTIVLDDPASAYVSRAALKLVAAIEACHMNVSDKTCLDIGASTGGFTQVLLEKGARHVIAIDVGHGQMAPVIAGNPAVSNLEGINARELTRETLDGRKIEIIVSDVSFISLKLALPPALELAEPGSVGVFLVKPQFEAGREHIGKGGLLREPAMGLQVARDLKNWIDSQAGWRHTHLLPSPVTGSDGNQEYLLCAGKNTDGPPKT
jgi:23S rRNA (cytidine1920-2'-O)/16S rRNA (cytidine1409-2'-O)-methyltransferase